MKVFVLTLLKSIACFCPRFIGKRDVLIASGKIYKITRPGEIKEYSLIENTFDCTGLYAFPGLIDQHVHITGAGGEQGFGSRTGELELSEFLQSGVTTAVGLLGADGVTRNMAGLYAKAKALEAQGLTTYIYSGSYAVPPVTLTGSLISDIVLVDKVIGAGEIAVSDHRSSNPDSKILTGIAGDAHLGGLLAGKAGVLHLHVGDGKKGLRVIEEMIRDSDLPMTQFVPTHLNRNPVLFKEAIEFGRSGGQIDLTAGEIEGLSVNKAVAALKDELPDLSKVTVSSDGGGSMPSGGQAKVQALFSDFVDIIKQSILPPEKAASLFTENVAKVLKICPKKGVIQTGSDADILITDKGYEIKMLFAMGRPLVNLTS